MSFTFDDMLKFATEAWGPLGTRTAHMWRIYNERYFDSALKPVPLVITNTQPFGKRLAFCSYGDANGQGRTITVNVPKNYDRLLADNCTLLHEMIHQYLFERGEYPSHDGVGWRREIMRLHKIITSTDLWAGRSTTKRIEKTVTRINVPDPETGLASLTQMQIARWPHDQPLIKLGALGEPCVTHSLELQTDAAVEL
jgi:hypothetical protein